MTRTTRGELDQLVVVLNNRLGRPQYQWDRVGGQNVCRVGALTLDRSYGGTRLHEVVNGGGGVREVSPRLPSGQMATFLRAILTGIDFAETNLGTGYGTLPDWSNPDERLRAVQAEVRAQRARGATPSIKQAVAKVDGKVAVEDIWG